MQAQEIIKRRGKLEQLRAPWENDWNKIVRTTVPQLAFSLQLTPRGKTRSEVVDDTAKEAVSVLVAGLDGFIFRGDVWRVEPRDELKSDPAAAAWAQAAQEDLARAMAHPKAGWPQARMMALRSCVSLGVCTVQADEVPGKHLRFRSTPIGETYIAENAGGRVDTVYRRYELTALQARDEFGADALPATVRRDLDTGNDPYNTHRFTHAVFPADQDNEAPKSRRHQYVSYHVHDEGPTIIRRAGYRQQCYHTARYERVDASAYGWSPVMTGLDEILRLNDMGRTNLRVAHQIAAPSLYARAGMFAKSIDRRPDAFNYYVANQAAGPAPEVKAFPTGSVPPWVQEVEESRRNWVRSLLMYYLLQVPQAQMTATEWIGRQGELYRQIGPIASQLAMELGEPIAQWSLYKLVDAGVIPPPPPPYSIDDFNATIEPPISRMEKAQQLDQVLRFGQSLQIPGSIDPGSLARVDLDAMVKVLAEANDVPPQLLHDDATFQAMQQARAQQQQAQQMLAAAPQLAGAVKDVADATSGEKGAGLRAIIGGRAA